MGRNFKATKMQYNYGKEMFTGRAKPIRIIGGPVNRISTVVQLLGY
jgi:hypothetical protein